MNRSNAATCRAGLYESLEWDARKLRVSHRHGGTDRKGQSETSLITMSMRFSTTHEKFSQLRMKIKQVRRIVVSAILDIAGEVRLYLGGNATPFVQRGRIAQENSSMLHHGSGEHE